MKKKKQIILLVMKYIVLCGLSIVFAFPFLWMLFGSFKTNNEIWQTPYQLFPKQIRFSELIQNIQAIHFGHYLLNSFFVAVVGTIVSILLSGMLAYAIVFLNNKNMNRIFALVLLTYMLPGAVTYVPSYVILARMHLLDKLSGLIFTYAADVFAVFYFRQSFLKTSRDFIEAARVDGGSEWFIFSQVVFPLNMPAFCTASLLCFIQLYNSYMWPSIMLKSDSKYLISQGLRQFFIQGGAYGMNWSQVMLASTIAILPVIILLVAAQKWIISAVAQEGGVKF